MHISPLQLRSRLNFARLTHSLTQYHPMVCINNATTTNNQGKTETGQQIKLFHFNLYHNVATYSTLMEADI